MIARIILFWFLGASLGFGDLPRHSSVTSVAFCLPANLFATVIFQYDANGNLTNDGTRSFYYDAENRLTNVTVATQYETVFVYDGLGRRRINLDSNWQSSVWVKTNETRYICDGMLVLQERNSNNTPVAIYTRGLDLSTSLAGAGGIGGMLARTDSNGTAYYHADGSGNITALIDGNANIVGRAMYDPYGKMIGLWGSMANINRYWYSSKELHPNGLYYFGFRYYEPNFGRWPNRDPIGEAGGINLYEFVGNDPLDNIDPDGLWTTAIHNYLIDHAFPNLTPAQLQILKDVSADVDSLIPGQLQKNDYQHAMSMPGEDKDKAAEKWTKFLQDQQNKAKKCSDRNKALSDFGRGLHALADSTSPSHRGFQPWEPEHAWAHHEKETSIGIDDYLNTINLMRQYYQTTFGTKAW